MLEINYAMRCCGVHEINGLSYHRKPESALLEFCGMIYPDPKKNKEKVEDAWKRATAAGCHPWDNNFVGSFNTGAVYEDITQYSKFRFAIFTEARHVKSDKPPVYGQTFAALIRKEKLGSLVSTAEYEINPNSGHEVMVWVWGIDHDALKAWYKKNSKENPWELKPMSAVIGGAAVAASPSVSPVAAYGTTVASAGSGSISNSALPTSGSLRQGNRW